MSVQLKEKPSFDRFKEYFKNAIATVTGLGAGDRERWLQIGDEGKREDVLRQLKQTLEGEYGVEFVWDRQVLNADIPLESVVIQLHHVYNTVYLMERINNRVFRNKNK